MNDSLTESVARLYRAGSEHSQQTRKLRKAVDDLISWLLLNVPSDLKPLPCDCQIWPSGDFARYGLTSPPDRGTAITLWRITRGNEHTLPELHQFCKLIADGFLDKLSQLLEKDSGSFKKTSVLLGSYTQVKRQYRIENWRFDVPLKTIETPVFEGETELECDKKAIKRMNELSELDIYIWDGLRVLRIDEPAIQERKTFLTDNGRQKA